MDRRYLRFCALDPLFYDLATGPDSDTDGGARDERYLAAAPLPEGWRESADRIWRSLGPVENTLPEQGWKVHVSATPGNAVRVLSLVAAHCAAHGITFKHLVTPRVVLARNSKYADRTSSGKFVTVYPRDDEQFAEIVAALTGLLDGESGPTILSDLRIDAGPVHVRYGAFREMWTIHEGERVPALRTPGGDLTADRREPRFIVPDFVTPPPFLAAHRERRAGGSFPYQVLGALHFSNGGGVYRAVALDGPHAGTEVVLKEGRPHAGLDEHGRDAVTRLEHERAILTRLVDVDAVPWCAEVLEVGGHRFLPQEQRRGTALSTWVTHHFPLVPADPDPDEVATYTRRALALTDRLAAVLDALHVRGVAFGDLHPDNVLVDDEDDDAVSLIDLELAGDADAPHHGMGAPGFTVAPGGTARDADRAALAVLRLWMFHPTAGVLALSTAVLPEWVAHVAATFPVPAAWLARLRAELPVPTPPTAPRATSTTSLVEALVAGIDAAATPHRADRLFPGDVRQFDVDGVCFGYGAAGVLHARLQAGAPSHPGHERWLLDAISRRPPRTPGFWEGAHGVAWALDGLGYRDAADHVLDGVHAAVPTGGASIGIRRGWAGVGLTLLDLADRRGDPELRAAGLAAARALCDELAAGTAADPAPAAGLLDGWSGAALLFLRALDLTGDPSWGDRAERALVRDLACAVPRPDGALHTRDPEHGRTLPYLGAGSAGVATALHALAQRAPTRSVVAALPALLSACRTRFVAHAGYSRGAAGLLHTVRTVTGHEASSDRPADPAVATHTAAIRRHLVPHGGGLVPAGHQLLRCSTDVDTGSAGILLALTDPGATSRDATPASLPWSALWRPAPVLAP